MKKKLLGMVLSTAALVTMLSAAPVAAFAAETGTNECDHAYVDLVEWSECDPVSGDQHMVTNHMIKECIKCEKIDSRWTETYYEDHFYTYNYDIGYWVCECGDSYRN